ncbi:MAG TPA: ribosome biogenesis factor YjgA [Casimicrobiaceae bacterium]
MRRSDETPRRTGQEDRGRRAPSRFAAPPTGVASDAAPGAPAADAPQPPSKTRRKAEMHDRQSLGEALVQLSPTRLAALALPERLADAIGQARAIGKHEARRRQLQFIGRLMRDVEPGPIRARLAQWGEAPAAEKARLAAVERWRVRLLAEPGALDALCAAAPGADRVLLASLVARVQAERAHAAPPHAYRELFRALNALLAADPA